MSEQRKELLVFLGITFLLTYAVQVFSLLQGSIEGGGYLGRLGPELSAGLQFAMFIPALVAIVLNQFVYRRDVYKGKARWFINYYFIMTAEMFVSFLSISVLKLHVTNPGVLQVLGLGTTVTSILGSVLLVALHMKSEWRNDLKEAKLSFGPIKYYLLFGGFLVFFFTVGAYLDRFFGLGVNPGVDFNTLVAGALNVIVITPALGITTAVFGEEYGWRIYLQDLLTSMYGKVPGVILLGIIWGLWHAPAVLVGWTYPGYGVLGLVMFTFYAMVIGVLLSYSSMLSGGVWVPAYVHAINNGFVNFSIYITTMNDPVFNFRLGVYGVTILALMMVALVWVRKEDWGLTSQQERS